MSTNVTGCDRVFACVSYGYHPRCTHIELAELRREVSEREGRKVWRSGKMGVPIAIDDDDDFKDEGGPAAPSKSLNSLAAEATMASVEADGSTELSREERARKALECDCVAELRDGPCGSQFSEAFYCFLTSTAPEQGSDCIKPFIAMQTCMTANPAAFVKYSNDVDGNNSIATEGEIKSQQDGPLVPSPPAGVVKNPIL